MYSSSLQYIPPGNAHQCNTWATELRVCTVSSSTEGLPNPWFMDHHHPHFIRRFGKTIEDVYTTENKITTATKFPTTETTGSKLSTLNITGRISKPGEHQYTFKPLLLTVTQLLKTECSFNGMSPLIKCTKRSLLPFLGDTLSLLTRRTITRDERDVKKRVNQQTATQTQQQETLVHFISILNITRCAMHVNRQHINAVMEAVERIHMTWSTSQAQYTHEKNYQQIILHLCSILVNLRDSLCYMRTDRYADNGLHRCSHYWYIITTCTSSRRFMRNAVSHWSRITISDALTSVIRWHPLLL